jgi:general secretion pathway protein H
MSGAAGRAAGFTMVEMLVVLAIVSMLAVIAVVSGAGRSRGELRAFARETAAAMRDVRGRAALVGAPQAIGVREDRWIRASGSGGRPPTALAVPAGLRVAPLGRAEVVFHPAGGSSGGGFRLERRDGSGAVDVTADWLTGRVSIAEQRAAAPARRALP